MQSSPEHDIVTWRDAGWAALSQQLSRAALRSPAHTPDPQPEAGPSKRPALEASSTVSVSSSHPRRRKRARLDETPQSTARAESSRIMADRLGELARRLSTQSSTSSGSPLHDRTNVRKAPSRTTGKEAAAGKGRERPTSRDQQGSMGRPAQPAGGSSTLSGKRSDRTPAPASARPARAVGLRGSPAKPIAGGSKALNGSPRPSAPPPRAVPANRALKPAAPSPKPKILTADLDDDDEMDEGDSFDLLLSQIPSKQLDELLGSSQQPKGKAVAKGDEVRKSPRLQEKQAVPPAFSQEAAAALCAGVGWSSDLEDL